MIDRLLAASGVRVDLESAVYRADNLIRPVRDGRARAPGAGRSALDLRRRRGRLGARAGGPLRRGAPLARACAPARDAGPAPLLPPRLRRGLRRPPRGDAHVVRAGARRQSRRSPFAGRRSRAHSSPARGGTPRTYHPRRESHPCVARRLAGRRGGRARRTRARVSPDVHADRPVSRVPRTRASGSPPADALGARARRVRPEARRAAGVDLPRSSPSRPSSLQEHVERLVHGGGVPMLVTSPAFLVGLALQVPSRSSPGRSRAGCSPSSRRSDRELALRPRLEFAVRPRKTRPRRRDRVFRARCRAALRFRPVSLIRRRLEAAPTTRGGPDEENSCSRLPACSPQSHSPAAAPTTARARRRPTRRRRRRRPRRPRRRRRRRPKRRRRPSSASPSSTARRRAASSARPSTRATGSSSS